MALAQGTQVGFGTTGFTANLKSIDTLSVNGEKIPTTHLGTSDGSTPAGATFVPNKIYVVEMAITVAFTPGVGVGQVPVLQDAETITITWQNGQKTTFSGFNTGVTFNNIEQGSTEELTASVTVAGTGSVSNLVKHS